MVQQVGVFLKHILDSFKGTNFAESCRKVDGQLRSLHLAKEAGLPLRLALPTRMHSNATALAAAKPLVRRGLELLKSSVQSKAATDPADCLGCDATIDRCVVQLIFKLAMHWKNLQFNFQCNVFRLLAPAEFDRVFDAVMVEAYSPALAALQADHDRRRLEPLNTMAWYGIPLTAIVNPSASVKKLRLRGSLQLRGTARLLL